MNLAEALADLRAVDNRHPRLARSDRLSKRADDTLIALASDVLAASLEGYALLRVSGKKSGNEEMRWSRESLKTSDRLC